MPIGRAPDNPAAPRHGFVDGLRLGTSATVPFCTNDEMGPGPPLHVHDYDEIFNIRQGARGFLSALR